MKENIIILGGGISGITTGLVLQLMGYETTIYSEYLVDDEAPEDPRFASLYPAASVIPHSVQSNKTDRLFPLSSRVFQFLWEHKFSGMQIHKHYELYEYKVQDPSYARFLNGYSRIDGADIKKIPHRKKSIHLSGWMFDCLITEWPIYIHELYKCYKEAGGTLRKERIHRHQIKDLNSHTIVNCTGIWSSELFADPEPLRAIKGHLLFLKGAPLIRDSSGSIPSYNYTPGKDIYSNPDGHATDVYFYPRSNGWILGGSRVQGEISESGTWGGKEHHDTIYINGNDIPRQIYELNRSIIANSFGFDLKQFTNIKALSGYRYVRSFDGNGLRLEETKEHGKTIIHNYGHGGAGVTLSWGCTLKVLEMIKKQTTNEETISNLKKALSRIV